MKALLILAVALFSFHALGDDAQVTIHLLDHTEAKVTETRFWIDWKEQWRGVVTSETVRGVAAEELIQQFRSSLKNTEASHFCGHNPIYGIEAIDRDGQLLKTSLCFSCLTWVRPGKRLDIKGGLGVNNDLCKLLRAVIELPPELINDDTAGK